MRSEYREQLAVSRTVLQGLVAALPQHPERAELEQGVARLRTAVSQREDSASAGLPGPSVGRQAGGDL